MVDCPAAAASTARGGGGALAAEAADPTPRDRSGGGGSDAFAAPERPTLRPDMMSRYKGTGPESDTGGSDAPPASAYARKRGLKREEPLS